MNREVIQNYAREKAVSPHEARQIFMQAVVLKHLSFPEARFMGGTALVLGYENPRFSEDIDLAQVTNPRLLEPGLVKAAREIEKWFGAPVSLASPKPPSGKPPSGKPGGATFRLLCRFGRSESVQLHVDSQPYRAYTTVPVVIRFPSLSPFICEAMDVWEIMAEKILALAFRRYLGGRDLFDLWFHWLRLNNGADRKEEIVRLVVLKLKERNLSREEMRRNLENRLSGKAPLNRARDEWARYLPPAFQKESVFGEIIGRSRCLLEF